MVKRIRSLWWLMLATLLTLIPSGNDPFWRFNIMELFASVAIVVGVLWAIRGSLKEHRRKDSLISFRHAWTAQRYLREDVVRVQARASVPLPYHSFHYQAHVRIKKSPFAMTSKAPEQSHSGQGHWFMTLEAPLTSLPKDAVQLEARVKIYLDGDVEKDSGWRALPITVYPPDVGFVKEPQR